LRPSAPLSERVKPTWWPYFTVRAGRKRTSDPRNLDDVFYRPPPRKVTQQTLITAANVFREYPPFYMN